MTTIFVGGPIQYVFNNQGLFNAELRDLIELLLNSLEKAGYKILSAHRYEDYGNLDVSDMQVEVCSRDFNWMNECNCFIAVLPVDIEGKPIRTDGTCVELGWASSLGKKIIIIHSSKATYSHLVSGLSGIADVQFIDFEELQRAGIEISSIIEPFLVKNKRAIDKDRKTQENLWSDWRWHIANRITTEEALQTWINVTERESQSIKKCEGKYRWSITPYYAALMDRNDEMCPIRRQAVPAPEEFIYYPNADVDPVGDQFYRKTNRVVHKYPDRVIMLITESCAVYCRHCTRKYHTTDLEGSYFKDKETQSFDEDFDYIASHPEIRDVLLTGGDPLMYSDQKLERIISRIRQISHVEIIRIGTRFPVLLPQRITPEFCQMLEKYHPIWLSTHYNHPKEITSEAAQACDRLLRHGIPVQNQTVLLKGINDDVLTMKELLKSLLKIRVRPYYLYHCDRVTGVSHFATSIEKGRELMKELIGHMTGFAVPNYIVTTKLGKIPLWEESAHQDGEGYWLENYQGKKEYFIDT